MKQGLYSICHAIRWPSDNQRSRESGTAENHGTLISIGKEKMFWEKYLAHPYCYTLTFTKRCWGGGGGWPRQVSRKVTLQNSMTSQGALTCDRSVPDVIGTQAVPERWWWSVCLVSVFGSLRPPFQVIKTFYGSQWRHFCKTFRCLKASISPYACISVCQGVKVSTGSLAWQLWYTVVFTIMKQE